MTRTRTGILAAWAMALLLGPLSAQQPPSLAPGQRVRLTAPAAHLTSRNGTVLALSRDTIVIGHIRRSLYGDTDTLIAAVPLRDLESLEVSLGRESYWKRGLWIGAAGGGVLGVLYGAIHGIDVTETGAYCDSRGWAPGIHCSGLIAPGLEASLIGGLAGTALGAVAGLAIGSLFHWERWEQVPLDRLRVAVVPQPGGRLGLAASLAF